MACSHACDLLFLLFGMLWCFGKSESVNTVNTGSMMTQYTGSEQWLLEGQEEK